MKLRYLLLAVSLLYSSSAEAYIGPGLGAGVVATVIGIVGAVLLAIAGIVYYPIKRLLKNRRKPPPPTEGGG
jgi:hypothetical protein